MRSSIAAYKESLSRIANDVFDAPEEVAASEPQPSRESPSPLSERRRSRRFSQSLSPSTSTIPNGADSTPRSEAEQYRVEIERLQASEAEIKALAFNYAAILKEKEGHLSRLHEENSSLKKSLEAKNGLAQAVSDESIKALKSTSGTYRGSNNQSPNRQNRHGTQGSPRSLENITQIKAISKQDIVSNGSSQASKNTQQNQDMRQTYLSKNEKELEILLEEKNNALASLRADYDSEINRLREELQNERGMSSNLILKFQDEQNLKESFRMELDHIKVENANISLQMKELQKQLDLKLEEIKHLQLEMERKNTEEASVESLRKLSDTVAALEKENDKLKAEKDKLDTAIKFGLEQNQGKVDVDDSELQNRASNSADKEKEEMGLRIQQLEKTLKDTYKERDKAQRELARLKQHLLEKELEESDKMDEDSKVIEELRSKYEFQKAHIMKLEMALKQEISRQEEIKIIKCNELQKSKEVVDELSQKIENYANLVEMKNVELLNLQTALGQYYAESEAKERLERELASAREESIKLFELLKVAKHDLELCEKGREEVVSALSQTEKMLADAKRTMQKLQDDNSKLHRAVEQSMTRINRMSVDSDFYVDRRIVIKLLVTYFQRNHSKEVLDLMVRMLGFSEEDKKRIGFAQEAAGRTVVRGVLGLPGRLVGGIMGGKQPAVSSDASSENQSFADLWVDFLLKDAEQKEKRELSESDRTAAVAQDKSPNSYDTYSKPTTSLSSGSTFSPVHSHTNQYSPILQKQTILSDSDSEFANVPLTSSASPATERSSRFSRLNLRY